MNCSICHTPTTKGQKFCTACGQALTITCPACGTAVTATARYCVSCGTCLVAEAGAKGDGKLLTIQTAPSLVSPTVPLGDRRFVTVLFADVSGFTTMSEKLDPEQVTEVINAFFKVLTEPIYQFGGIVDKYIGDAIMALFGAPVAHEDDPERAVMAAYEMRKAARVFADKLAATTGIRLMVRIGLNTGLVVAGAVGGQQRQDYTVMGDTVNLAQRMESAAPIGGILVSQETYRLTQQLFEFKARELIHVKGKAAPVYTYEVIGLLPQQARVVGRQFALRGRAAECDRLKEILARGARGEPVFVMVAGEAGSGKSRLLRE
ncbi:MAG: zinc ribbon domain-containing protein, partial [Cyanobacteria bacterium NC_groundwater_1444_Ag_S-0.65um_54_12]|nr:zinc ribbon domain-containing protein [Cyanobacteria bacterium NC_groundwater_1444_Ag_S-0.65um_54_12]